MNKIKKLLKSCLVACLLITGLVMNPLNIKANEASTYAAPSQLITETIYLDYATINLKFYKIVTGGLTTLDYQGATCKAFSGYGTSCTVDDVDVIGRSDSDADSYLYIFVTVNLSGTTYDRKYKITYFANEYKSHNKVSSY